MALEGFVRYAVYFAPPETGALARRGAAWLGRDASGAPPPPPPDAVDPQRRAALVASPARYGLHGTLKAPFRLAEGVRAEALDRAVAALAQDAAPVEMDGLRVSAELGFCALLPGGAQAAASALASRCVVELDHLRAPLSDAEIARRRPDRLDRAAAANLRRWGYPYVLDRFRFHITLTGPVAPSEAASLETALHGLFDDALAPRFAIDALCLFGDPGEGRPFQLLRRHMLGGAASLAGG